MKEILRRSSNSITVRKTMVKRTLLYSSILNRYLSPAFPQKLKRLSSSGPSSSLSRTLGTSIGGRKTRPPKCTDTKTNRQIKLSNSARNLCFEPNLFDSGEKSATSGSPRMNGNDTVQDRCRYFSQTIRTITFVNGTTGGGCRQSVELIFPAFDYFSAAT